MSLLPKHNAQIAVLKGDGIGEDVTNQAVRVLEFISSFFGYKFTFHEYLVGGIAIDHEGVALPEKTLIAAQNADAVLFGAVGGPKWTGKVKPEDGILGLRKGLGLFANLRPIQILSEDLSSKISPLKAERIKGVDILFVRELTGGAYFGPKKENENNEGKAYDTILYTREEIERVTRLAAEAATHRRKKITHVHKANVLASSRLWVEVVNQIIQQEFPSIELDHMLVDTASMKLLLNPTQFDVILTENMFGDILTDEGAAIPGSIGLLASASLNGKSGKGLYEPIHGSAPDIAGKGIANPIGAILSASMLLHFSLGLTEESKLVEESVRDALLKGARTPDISTFGDQTITTEQMGDIILENLKIRCEAAKKAREAKPKRRGMNIIEKILCHHAIGLKEPYVTPGDVLCVKVDWTLASELTWKGMDKTYHEMGRPTIWRNDRFWLAIDHTVDPSINHLPRAKGLIEASESFAKEANILDFHQPNETIMHTEFYRERVQPGMVIIGADSHTCSAGGLGALAIGLGAADVVIPLVTGETWLKVPETLRIHYAGKLKFGIGGKDVILHTMGKLKRNTVAFERAVEYTGDLSSLSCDARFAVSNMSVEFGGIAGVFEPDEITASYINNRKNPHHKNQGLYFKADKDAEYAETHVIQLDEVETTIALYPSPDNVVPVGDVAGTPLDGCFIGACTTAEEDLILAALVLQEGIKKGYTKNFPKGKRKVTPGSVQIIAKLRRLGLLQVYESAHFELGAPGCSYCLGVAADKAGEGEVWLSSQNRNFPNRMGKGSIGNLSSAACVAASSFEMKIADPRPLLDSIDKETFYNMLDVWLDKKIPIQISDPKPELSSHTINKSLNEEFSPQNFQKLIQGKVQRFEDNIDTDAIIPAEFMPGISDEDLGTHAFQYFRPDFVKKVVSGFNIVVGGTGFGTGSSREEAPRALRGCGIQCVIAKSFAFIYSRNQPLMSLLGITLKDEKFYELAQEGEEVVVDVASRVVKIKGETFPFGLSLMEERLLAGGGVTSMFKKHKNDLFRVAISSGDGSCEKPSCESDSSKKELSW